MHTLKTVKENVDKLDCINLNYVNSTSKKKPQKTP